MSDQLLTFGKENAKLAGSKTTTFALPAGTSCPGACDCLAKFDRKSKKVVDGKKQKFRCYSASLEAIYPSLRISVDKNMKLLKAAKTELEMARLIRYSMPSAFWENVRIHWDGDFFNASYFRAWCRVAAGDPDRLFYAYTKSLPTWIDNLDMVPDNMVLTASKGGRYDHMIEPNNLRSATVVFHPEIAERLGLEIDHDDSHARRDDGKDFALLIHNTQPKGSDAAEAVKRLKAEKVRFSYSKKRKIIEKL